MFHCDTENHSTVKIQNFQFDIIVNVRCEAVSHSLSRAVNVFCNAADFTIRCTAFHWRLICWGMPYFLGFIYKISSIQWHFFVEFQEQMTIVFDSLKCSTLSNSIQNVSCEVNDDSENQIVDHWSMQFDVVPGKSINSVFVRLISNIFGYKRHSIFLFYVD